MRVFFSRRSEVHTEVDYSECEEATGSQCFRDTENAAEFTAEALRTQHFDSPVTVLSVESRSSDVTILRNVLDVSLLYTQFRGGYKLQMNERFCY